jgi:hypothetical protein
LVQLLAVVVVFLLISVSAFSQAGSSSIQGTLTDKSGGVVQGATVTVLDVARGTNRVLTTDGAGQWVATNVIPGTYTVRAEAKGFSTTERSGVAVEVGQTIRIDLELQPGEQTQTVTVTGEIPFINAADAQLGGTVSNEAIQQLPLNGRNFQRLLQLHPGVVTTPGSGTGNGDFTNGRKQGDDLFRVEGISTIAQTANLSGVLNGAYRSGDSSSLLPLDAIQEFNTAQSPKAEDGWKEGSVVSIGIKSGTNSIHGTAFAFGRDAEKTDAANFFTGTVTDATLEQFGGSAGGPIFKDKLFWFASYEGLRDVLHGNAAVSVPASVSTGAGNSLVDACNFVKTTGVSGNKTINPLSAQLVGLNPATCVVTPSSSTVENLYPFNTTGSFTPGLETTGPLNNGIFKADYVPGAKHHISGVFFRTRADQVVNTAAGQLLPQWRNGVIDRVDFSTVAWTWIPNSTWVNDLRWGLAFFKNETTVLDGNINPAAPWPTGYGINTGVTNPLYFGMPFVTITGFTSQLGIGNNEPTVRGPEGNWSITDNVSYLHGKHSFKFGFEFIEVLWDEGIGGNVQAPYAGSVTFANLNNFLAGVPQRGTILVGDNTNNFRQHYYAGFAQDDWRLTSRLTLNLGLRYEFKGSPYEQNNYFGGFNPNVNPATTPAVQAVGPGAPIPRYYNNNWDELSPRLGMAWDVRGDGKTVVRASGSLMRDYAPLNTLIKNAPFGANYPDLNVNTSGTVQNQKTVNSYSLQAGQISWATAGPVFPTAVSQTVNGVTYSGVTCTKTSDTVNGRVNGGSPCTVTTIDPSFKYPRVAEWSLDVQRAIAKGLAIDVAYVGNYGWNETSSVQLNMPTLGAGWTTAKINTCLASKPTYNQCTPDTTQEVGQYSAIFPYFNFITQNQSHSKSNYNALQVTANQRAFHGLSFIAGYTYSHSLDNTPDGSPYNPVDLSRYYGSGVADIRNRFSFSPTYQIPGIKSPAQMLQGWSVNAIVLMQSGQPWTPNDTVSTSEDIIGTGNGSGATQYWNYAGPKSAFQTTFNPIPCYGGTFQGCTAFASAPAAIQTACTNAATAPYGGSGTQLGQLALASLANFGCYAQGDGVLTPPAYGTTGTASKGFFGGPVYYNLDFSVAKLWKVKERYTAQFRVEFFNFFNRVDLALTPTSVSPSSGFSGQFGCSCTTPDTGNRNLNPVLGSGGPRHVQFGLKLTF